MNRLRLGLLVGAMVLAGLLRLPFLDRFPAGFTADEAALGYNAYTLLLTGKDEWGVPWWKLPLTSLRSFGDYKLPLYSFLAVPTVKLGGLNEYFVRLPNALVGTLAIVGVYLLTSQFWPAASAVAALLLAVSSWHVGLSRGAFEANLATLFLPLGIYGGLRRRFVTSAFFFSLGFYSYHSARFLVFPLVLLLLWYLRPVWQRVIIYLGLLLVLTGPGWWSLFLGGATRVTDVGIFHPTDNWSAVANRRFEARNWGLPDGVARVFSNKAVYLASSFSQNYLSYLSSDFLFVRGAGEATYGLMPGRGVLYLIELPVVLFFLIRLVRHPHPRGVFLVALLLTSVLPAALAKGLGYAANRAVSMLPFLTVMAAVSLTYLIKLTKTPPVKLAVGTIYFLSLLFFLEDYVYHLPPISARAMNYGWKEAIARLIPISESFPEVHVSRSLSEPHIFLAFYLPVPPPQYQAAAQGWAGFEKKYKFLDQYDGYHLGKFRFGNISPSEPTATSTLFVGRPEDFPAGYPEYFHIDYLGGGAAIKVSPSGFRI